MELDSVDRHILSVLQENCKLPLVKIGERVGLSAPSVAERIDKLENGAGGTLSPSPAPDSELTRT